MKPFTSAILAIAALVILACASAHASPITFVYTGHLTQIASLDPASPFPDPITDDPSNPTSFSGSFTFDSLAADAVPGDPATGSYPSSGGPYTFTLSLGGLTFAFGGVNIGVLDNYPFPIGDQYQALYFENPTNDNPTGIQLLVQLTDLTALAFSSDALPLTPPALPDFTFTYFFFTDTIDGNQVEVAGVIDSLQAAPEPATLLLAATALAMIAGQRARRSRLAQGA